MKDADKGAVRALVTGAAGFIGSSLCDRLLADGHTVIGLDAFTDYYDVTQKERNLDRAAAHRNFALVRDDLRAADLDPLLADVDVVFHNAGQPGVRKSWGTGFDEYAQANVVATQRLLEAARRVDLGRFVYASSSSIYGAALAYPTLETDTPAPHSPYAVTKLAGEQLCTLYHRNFGVPTVALRYFTVYGPRQRPDMAIHRLITSAMNGEPFTMFGDGTQIRDFTFVGDAVEANLAAASATAAIGEVFNVGGGSAASMLEVVDQVTHAVGRAPNVVFGDNEAGDVFRTGAAIDLAAERLGWAPTTPLADGIAAQAEHLASRA